MNNLHGLIMAYRSNENLGELTRPRNTCSVPIFGRYRLIDFMLSNFVNAGMTDVGVIVHESYQSLLDHIGSGKDWDLSRKRGGLRILPPFGDAQRGRGEYHGSIEALSGVRSYLEKIRQDYVITSWGDFVVNLDVNEIFQQHLESGADVTVVCSNVNRGDYLDADFITMDDTGRVTKMVVRPTEAVEGLVSLETYIFSKTLLLKIVDDCIAQEIYSMNRGALARSLDKLNVRGYVHTGYAARPLSVSGYLRRSMEMLDRDVRAELFNPARPIRTKDTSNPSSYYGPESNVSNSLISDGCNIRGEVENCILSRGVTIEAGAKVSGCILMHGTTVKAGAEMSHVITDKGVTITEGRTLAGHPTYPLTIAKFATV